jgi:hypothetical protein
MINDPQKTLGKKRSPHWRQLRKEFIAENPSCLACGGTKKLEVHHVKPFHLHPELELDRKNLVTLCESGKHGVVCHLAWGHCGNYKKVNKHVFRDAIRWMKRLSTAIIPFSR